MSRLGLLDHVVIAGPDLAALVDRFAERTGVVAAPGGAHPTGTANALVALTRDGERGPQYLELIGPDPERTDPAMPTTFGIDALTGPVVATYAVHPDDIVASVEQARSQGVDPGDVQPLSRRTPTGELLEWRLTRGQERRPELPFLIDWGATPQPGLGVLPTVELVDLVRTEVDPAPIAADLAAYGLGEGAAEVVAGERSGYRLTLRGADGQLVELV